MGHSPTRARLAILIALVATGFSLAAFASPVLAYDLTLTQETDGGDEDSETGGTETEGDSEGSESEGEEGEAAAETGPPWTYQMARIALVLLVLTLAGVAFAYYRFVATRRREGF